MDMTNPGHLMILREKLVRHRADMDALIQALEVLENDPRNLVAALAAQRAQKAWMESGRDVGQVFRAFRKAPSPGAGEG